MLPQEPPFLDGAVGMARVWHAMDIAQADALINAWRRKHGLAISGPAPSMTTRQMLRAYRLVCDEGITARGVALIEWALSTNQVRL